MTPDDLRVDTRDERGCAVLAVAGELDVYSSPRLRGALQRAMTPARGALVVDLTDVPFMDSSGLGVLVGAHKRMAADGGVLLVVTDQPLLLKLFRITGLKAVFALYPTLDSYIPG
jgi:anti-sigma B factor antagonist